MTDVKELQALLERVEKAEGPDWEINAEIAELGGLIFDEMRGVWTTPDAQPNEFIILPNYTASIDASVALVEKVLPMGVWSIYNSDPKCATKGGSAFLFADSDDEESVRAAGATPALALIAALLRAIISNGGE